MRLLNVHRDSIVRRMRDVAEAKLIRPAEAKLSELVYTAVYRNDLARRSVPAAFVGPWIPTAASIRIRFVPHNYDPAMDDWDSDYETVKLPHAVPVRVLENSGGYADVDLGMFSSSVQREIYAAIVALNKARDDVKAIEMSIKRIMATCNTTKQLEETLPESAPFLPTEDGSSVRELSYPLAMTDIEKIRAVFAPGA